MASGYAPPSKADIEALKKAEEDRKAAEPIDVTKDRGARLLLMQSRAALAARRFDDMVRCNRGAAGAACASPHAR